MSKIFLRMVLGAVLGLLALTAVASINVYSFDDPKDEARFKRLSEELRCLVCQNQNLADSNAELAQDLRREVYTMINAGKSDDEIVDFMVQRYGDFVLYRPPVKSSTYLLWVGPFVLFIVGAGTLSLMVRRRNAEKTEGALNTEEQARLQQLLREKGETHS